MKNDKIINSWNKLNPDDVSKDRILYRIEKKQEKPRRILRPVISAAAAVVIFFAILGFFSMPQEDNIFSVKAYALYEEDDGTIGMREVDLVNQTDSWGGYYDGQYFYASIGLKYEGDNIMNVDFSVDEGFFAKQYIEENSEGVSKLYIRDNQLVVYGDEFEIVGDEITLDDETMTDNLLLFWGIETPDITNSIPEKIDIRAEVIFNDETTQAQTIVIPLNGENTIGMYTYLVSEEELQQMEAEQEYYNNIPLEQCELVLESVKTVTDVYEYEGSDITVRFDEIKKMEFDENGINRNGWFEDNGEIYFPVIERKNDEYIGKLYRVPEELLFRAD